MNLKTNVSILFILTFYSVFSNTDSSEKKIIGKLVNVTTVNKNVSKKDSSTENIKLDSINTNEFQPKSYEYLIDSISLLNNKIAVLCDLNNTLFNKIEKLEKGIQVKNKGCSNNISNYFLKKNYLVILIAIAFVVVIFFIKKMNLFNSLINMKIRKKQSKKSLIEKQQKELALKTKANSNQETSKNKTQSLDTIIEQTTHIKSFSNNLYNLSKTKEKKGEWFIVGGSSIGSSHISSNKPCQDNHYCNRISDSWGIAIVCDGAGTAPNSQIGSKFVSENIFIILKEEILKNNYIKSNKLPNETEWCDITNTSFRLVSKKLFDYTQKNNIEFSSVACTLIVVVFTPLGLLVAHIGDGRAGYCDSQAEWHQMLVPHKGEEANQTIFITSQHWMNDKNFKMSNVLVPQSLIINEKVKAFTLMSDGCENHSFECSKIDTETNQWTDPNKPYDKFFNPLYNQLTTMNINNLSIEEANKMWLKFLESGTSGLKEEADDKSMIMGVLI